MTIYFQDEHYFSYWCIENGENITLPKVLLPLLQNLPEGYKFMYAESIFEYKFSKRFQGFVDQFVKLTKNQMILAAGNYICDDYGVYTNYEMLFGKKKSKEPMLIHLKITLQSMWSHLKSMRKRNYGQRG